MSQKHALVLLLYIIFVSYASCWCVLCCRVCSLWSPAGKGLTSWLSCFVTFPNVYWSTSELEARLAPWNWFKPSFKIFYWPFQGGTSFVDLLCCFCLVFVMPLYARLFISALWSPAGKRMTSWLSYVVSNCEFVTFPLVSWVSCGTWLYQFLIFAPLLTLHTKWNQPFLLYFSNFAV